MMGRDLPTVLGPAPGILRGEGSVSQLGSCLGGFFFPLLAPSWSCGTSCSVTLVGLGGGRQGWGQAKTSTGISEPSLLPVPSVSSSPPLHQQSPASP